MTSDTRRTAVEIRPCDDSVASRFIDDIPELVFSTGPATYEYTFGTRSVFDAVVRRSWLTPGTLFSADESSVAFSGDALLGIEIGFPGSAFRKRGHALGSLLSGLIAAGEVKGDDVGGLVMRAEETSWLNPVVRPWCYFVNSIAVKPEHHGKGVGRELLANAKRRARNFQCTRLELDVLADNPAIRFYRSQGLELLAETSVPGPASRGVPPVWRMGMELELE